MFDKSLGLDGALGESQYGFEGVYEQGKGLGADGSAETSKWSLEIGERKN